MTPKEKAEDLVKKFSAVGLQRRAEGIVCALIAVDEIIKSVVITDLTTAENQFIYWQQVKQEIENL